MRQVRRRPDRKCQRRCLGLRGQQRQADVGCQGDEVRLRGMRDALPNTRGFLRHGWQAVADVAHRLHASRLSHPKDLRRGAAEQYPWLGALSRQTVGRVDDAVQLDFAHGLGPVNLPERRELPDGDTVLAAEGDEPQGGALRPYWLVDPGRHQVHGEHGAVMALCRGARADLPSPGGGRRSHRVPHHEAPVGGPADELVGAVRREPAERQDAGRRGLHPRESGKELERVDVEAAHDAV
mmetsp:Transcript_38092/g.90494  ORF Transcript_38092/g.90494 Transcript_38092/m.90494 type:complete len:238 (-) Transcript_38092:668-1381(-)